MQTIKPRPDRLGHVVVDIRFGTGTIKRCVNCGYIIADEGKPFLCRAV